MNLFQPFEFVKKALVDHGIGMAAKLIKSGIQNINSKKDHTNEEFLKAKFDSQLDHIDPNLLKPRICMGKQ
jgi:hypothetical protein